MSCMHIHFPFRGLGDYHFSIRSVGYLCLAGNLPTYYRGCILYSPYWLFGVQKVIYVSITMVTL